MPAGGPGLGGRGGWSRLLCGLGRWGRGRSQRGLGAEGAPVEGPGKEERWSPPEGPGRWVGGVGSLTEGPREVRSKITRDMIET